MDGFAGVTAIELKAGATALTGSVVVPVIEPDAAFIVAEQAVTPDASPEAEIVATAVFKDVHVTELVKFWVLASENVPVAVNCCVAPVPIEGLGGVTAIELSVAGETLKTVGPGPAPDAA